MSIFKGHKIDYNQAEAATKLAETAERRKNVRAECYKVIEKQLNDELLQIKKFFPNCVAVETSTSADYAGISEDYIFKYSHSQNFEGYVINTYLVTNEINFQKDCYEDNYHEKLEWSYGLTETVNASYVIFKSEEDRKNYVDIGKYLKIKNFSKEEFVKYDKILKSESTKKLNHDRENLETAKKSYYADKRKFKILTLTNRLINLPSIIFYMLACVSLFMICYDKEIDFFIWFIELPFYYYILIWAINLFCFIISAIVLRRVKGCRINSSSICVLVFTALATAIIVAVSLELEYFLGGDPDAIKWLKALTYISAFFDIVAILNSFYPIRFQLKDPEILLRDRESRYDDAQKYMNDSTNKKCMELLSGRESSLISKKALNSEKGKLKRQERIIEEQNIVDETEEILKKFEG